MLWSFPVSGEIEVKIGQLLQGVVGRIDKVHKVIYLSCDLDTVSKCVVCIHLTLNCVILFPSLTVSFLIRHFCYVALLCRPRILRVFQLIFSFQAWWLMLAYSQLLKMVLCYHSLLISLELWACCALLYFSIYDVKFNISIQWLYFCL